MIYWVRRLVQAGIVVWAAFTLTFGVLWVLPGDTIELMTSAGAATGALPTEFLEEETQELRARYGYDKPLVVQYGQALWRAVQGDFGTSVRQQRPAAELVLESLPPTVVMGLVSVVFAVVGALVVAFFTSYTRMRLVRSLADAAPSVAVAIPQFLAGMILIDVFSFRLGWFPPAGDSGWKSVVLPAMALAMPTGAYLAQVLSRSMQSTLNEPFIATARSKGASNLRVYFSHALRNAVIPTLTLFGLIVGSIFGGAVLIETTFARRGVGQVLITAVMHRDVPVVGCVVVVSSAAYVVSNLAVDVVVGWLDPRTGIGSRRLGRRAVSSSPDDERRGMEPPVSL